MATVSPAARAVSSTPSHVFLFDVDEEASEILSSPVSDLQIERAPTVSQGTIDGSRVLCIGRLDDLGRTTAAIEKLALAPSVERTICLLSGRPAERTDHVGPQVAIPTALQSLGCTVIWVGDPRGVVWAVGYSKAQKLAVFADDPEGKGAFTVLQECLRLPEVFDEVFERGQQVRTVFSPALRVVVPGVSNPKLLSSALTSTLQTLSGDPSEAVVADEDLPEGLVRHPELLGQAVPPMDLFTADGQIGALASEMERARLDAVEKASRLEWPTSRSRVEDAERTVQEVGSKLANLRQALRTLFGSIEASDGLNANEQRQLEKAGIIENVMSLYLQEGRGGAEREEAVREFAFAEIREQRTLAQVAGELRSLAVRATPRTAEQTHALLDEVLPESTSAGLRADRRVRLRFGKPLGLLSLAVASAMWWPGVSWLIAFGLLAASGIYLASLTVRPLPPARSWLQLGAQSVHNRGFWQVFAAIFVGIALGGIMQALLGSIELGVVGVIVFLASAAGFSRLTWRMSVAAWLEQTGLLTLESTLERLMTALKVVAVNDWLLADERTHFAMTVRRLAESVEKIRGTIIESLETLSTHGLKSFREAAMFTCNPAVRADLSEGGTSELYEHSDVIERIVLSDHLDAIVRSVEEEWPLLTAKAGERASDEINSRVSKWLESYRRSIMERGLFSDEDLDSTDLSSEGRARRSDLLETLWRDLDLAGVLGDLGELVQFCAAEDLGMLDQSERVQLVKFVPAQRFSDGEVDRPVRTASMLMAGALRLVALRAGTVSVEG